jgi:cytochrome P450
MTADLRVPTPTAPGGTRRARAGLSLLAARLAVRAAALSGDPTARFFTAGPDGDVYAAHERIRAQGPVARSRLGVYAVTSRRLCDEVLRDPRFHVRSPDGPAGVDRITQDAVGPLAGSLLDLDPPDHTRLRRIVAPAFRPRAMRAYAVRVEAIARRMLEGLDGRDEFDLVRDLASPFPITVISDLLGVPDVDTAHFAQVGMLVGQSLDGVTSVRQADALRVASGELTELFLRLADDRRDVPGDDVVGLVARAQAEGQITPTELVSTCGLLLVAGFETTVNLIGNAVAALHADRAGWERLVADPAVAPRVVEETLRYDPPVQLTARTTHEETELAGVPLPRGAVVLTVLAAANRDPGVYREPARFDLDRDADEPEHLTFSAGIHYCLGAPLARVEADVVLRLLAERFPRLRPVGGARRRRGTTLRGFASYPVRVA